MLAVPLGHSTILFLDLSNSFKIVWGNIGTYTSSTTITISSSMNTAILKAWIALKTSTSVNVQACSWFQAEYSGTSSIKIYGDSNSSKLTRGYVCIGY